MRMRARAWLRPFSLLRHPAAVVVHGCLRAEVVGARKGSDTALILKPAAMGPGAVTSCDNGNTNASYCAPGTRGRPVNVTPCVLPGTMSSRVAKPGNGISLILTRNARAVAGAVQSKLTPPVGVTVKLMISGMENSGGAALMVNVFVYEVPPTIARAV